MWRRRRRRSGARLDPHVHLHGRHPGAIGLRQGHAGRHRGPDEVVPRRAGRVASWSWAPSWRRRSACVGAAVITPVGDRAAADAQGGLRQATRHRHHRLGRHARHPDSAGDHAGGDGRDAGDARPATCSSARSCRASGCPASTSSTSSRVADPEAGHGAEAAAGFRAADPRASSGARVGAACSR